MAGKYSLDAREQAAQTRKYGIKEIVSALIDGTYKDRIINRMHDNGVGKVVRALAVNGD
jgi:hypothetical protein